MIDDEEYVLDIEEAILQRLGYKVELKSSSLEALESIKADPDRYDLILSDMTMPDMTGDQLTREILKINPALPVII